MGDNEKHAEEQENKDGQGSASDQEGGTDPSPGDPGLGAGLGASVGGPGPSYFGPGLNAGVGSDESGKEEESS